MPLKMTRIDEDGCDEIILCDTRVRRPRPRIPTTAELRREKIDQAEADFRIFAKLNFKFPWFKRANILANGKSAGVGFIAIDTENTKRKIVRTHFFGPKGY